jgi:hypothetical protein
VDVFEQLDVVSIVDMDSDEHRTRCIKCLAQSWCNLVRSLNLETGGAERFGILHVIDRTEIDSGRHSRVFQAPLDCAASSLYSGL